MDRIRSPSTFNEFSRFKLAKRGERWDCQSTDYSRHVDQRLERGPNRRSSPMKSRMPLLSCRLGGRSADPRRTVTAVYTLLTFVFVAVLSGCVAIPRKTTLTQIETGEICYGGFNL